MPQVREILFPVDFSNPCAQFAGTVAAVAAHFQAGLTLLHVETMPLLPVLVYSSDAYATSRGGLREASLRSMNCFVQQHIPSAGVKISIQEGDPAQSILASINQCRSDLVMMPTHGQGTFRRFLAGSVTARVLQDAACPVWTSAHLKLSDTAVNAGWRNIICAVDRNSCAVALMRWAEWFADQVQGSVKWMHVIPAEDETSHNCGEVRLRHYLLERAHSDFRILMDQADVHGEILFRGGNIPGRIAETVRQQNAELLIVGRGHMRSTLGRLRTHTLAIIRESPCPVISV